VSALLEHLGLLAPSWRDVIEIVLVTAIFYRLLILLAGTRAIQMLLGLVLLVGVYFVARVLQLELLRYLLENLFQFGAIAALVVFQPELRSALAHLGQNRLLRFFNRLEETEVAEEIALAAEELARNQVGAIIAIEREVGLGEYIDTGTPLQARVSAALLNTIFSPYSPLHDGAAIVRGDTIVAAGAILPLTQFPVADKSLGTRHRAALGLSEESDALVVVVSEETSQISLAHRGQLQRGFDRERLAALLAAYTRRTTFG
jgi:diadenylate cyclase